MSRGIHIPQWITQTISIAIERLGIRRTHRDVVLLARLAIPLEERPELRDLAIFFVDLRDQLTQVYRERRQAGVAVVAQGGCTATRAAGCAGHDTIRLDEASQRAVVVACLVKIQPYLDIVDLPGELPVSRRSAAAVACLSPRIIAQFAAFRCAIDRDGGAAQVVAEEEVQRAAPLTHRYPLPTDVVVLDHRARTARPLEVVAHVIGGHAVQHGFDAGVVPS